MARRQATVEDVIEGQRCDIVTPGTMIEWSPDDVPALPERPDPKNKKKKLPARAYKRADDDVRRSFTYELQADQVLNEIFQNSTATVTQNLGLVGANTFTGLMTSQIDGARETLRETLRDWSNIKNQDGKEIPFTKEAIGWLSHKLLMSASAEVFQSSLEAGIAGKKS